MSDENFYRVIADELESNNTDKAVWTQAFAVAEGNLEKTRAQYIRLRLASLKRMGVVTPSYAMPDHKVAQAAVPAVGSLARLRADLAVRLRRTGKTSLYFTLAIEPSADDAEVAAVIAAMEKQIQSGAIVASTEYKLARETLGDPKLREQYDRRLIDHFISVDRPSVTSASYEYAGNESDGGFMDWWQSRKMTAIIGVLSITVLGYLLLGFTKARSSHDIQKGALEVQKDVVGVQREAVGVVGEVENARVMNERLRIENENNVRNHNIAIMEMNAERQRQESMARLEMQRQEQERRVGMEQERLRVQQTQSEERAQQRERQYWTCMNAQLNNVNYGDASNRCRGYR